MSDVIAFGLAIAESGANDPAGIWPGKNRRVIINATQTHGSSGQPG